ncbi:nuclease-related domain-containing protein [Neobacillus drentensis]|uniref:nuclease-related domain-containing protein n=1 Tax=Neobacillus drentensis TaxID=220684 RepID=UPI002FFFFBF9
MAYKNRNESGELLILRILNRRMGLKAEEQKKYLNLEKGFKGETQFDELTENLQSQCIILNELLLEVNESKFQIDTTIIFQDAIYPFEVKNYDGDFIYKPDRLKKISGKDYKNPLDQLKRTQFLFSQLLQNLGYNIPIEGSVVFINPEFTLYEAPPNKPFVFPTQLNQLIKKLEKVPAKLTNRHFKLADKLVSLHQIESPYTRLPPYDYNQQKKGITCAKCNSFNVTFSTGARKVFCDICKCEEGIESAILRNVEEIKLLFPDIKITTNLVYEWCSGVVAKKTIKKYLKKNYQSIGNKKYTYYI